MSIDENRALFDNIFSLNNLCIIISAADPFISLLDERNEIKI
jgi:hypothetical protein